MFIKESDSNGRNKALVRLILLVLIVSISAFGLSACGGKYKSGDYNETMYRMSSLQDSSADTDAVQESSYHITIDGSTITFKDGSTVIGSGKIKGESITWDEDSYSYDTPYNDIMSGLLSVSVSETSITKVDGSDDVMIAFTWIAIGYGDWITSYYFEKV